MSSLRIAPVLLAVSLAAAACISPDDDQTTTPTTDLSGNEILLTSGLVTVDSCDALLERLKDEAMERVGPYGFGGGFYGPVAFDEAEEAMSTDDAASTDTGGAPATTTQAAGESAGLDRAADGSFSETNNQEQGVDEADLVKTDGRVLVTVTGNRLRVIDVAGAEPELVNSIELPEEFYGGELFLNGNTALLMTSGWTAVPFVGPDIASDWYPGSPTGRIIEIDLDRGSIERTLEFEGGYLSAREIDGSIRIVMSAAENRFNFVFPSNPGAEESAERTNRQLIEDSTIEMWIPTYRITEGDQTVEEGPIVDCDRVHLPRDFAGFGSLVVLTADIDDGLNISDALSVFTDGQTVYASEDRLAVATPRWPEYDGNGEPIGDEDYRTAIHTFDISDPATSEYSASGSVRGFLLNQYSLSDYEGHLRVATTDGTPWDSSSSESFLTVLGEDGDRLTEVGQVGGLGEGEQIFAVRFLGPTAYVVTFRQTDPLYTLDLSDPGNPRVTGELKIPGVSDYLHPYGDFLIAVGRDGTEEGLSGGAVVSLFDVSDQENPMMVAKEPLGPRSTSETRFIDSYSPVAGDARAFTMWGDTVIVPITWWSYDESRESFEENSGSAAVLVQVDDDDGTLTTIGQVAHPVTRECEGGGLEPLQEPEVSVERTEADGPVTTLAPTDAEADFARPDEEPPAEEIVPAPGDPEQYCFTYQPEIRRSVIIDDNLYTISDAGVAVNEFDGLATVTWIPFER